MEQHPYVAPPVVSPALAARSRPLCRTLALVVFSLSAVAAPTPASAHAPPNGSQAAAITLLDVEGREVDTAGLKPRSQVIIFGDLSHEGVRKACADVLDVTARHTHAADPPAVLLIVQHESPEQLRKEIAGGHLPELVLRDPDRTAFGAYRVLVMPTVVVVDPAGTVRYSMSGPVQYFQEKLSAALQLAAGKMTEEQFQRAISPDAPSATAGATRADRLTHLGHELVRHGLLELAEARFREAVTIAPDRVEPKLGLAGVLVHTGRLDEADAAYRDVAAAEAGSIDAAIGLATVQAMRGGESLDKADLAASELVARYPSSPRVRFLMGLVYERKGNWQAALGEYKRAAELLLLDAPASPLKPPAERTTK